MPGDERLQQSFWLSEFLRSDTGLRLGLDNTPPALAMGNIKHILAPGLQRVRNRLGVPVFITSGYRSQAINRLVGSSESSQHRQGLAADFVAPEFGTARRIARELMEHAGEIRYDQMIYEGQWVHISFVPASPRFDVLTAHFTGGAVEYTRGLA